MLFALFQYFMKYNFQLSFTHCHFVCIDISSRIGFKCHLLCFDIS